MYNPYLISPDSFWVGQKTTELFESTYWYVPVHTASYQYGILVLPCTRGLGQLVEFVPKRFAGITIIDDYRHCLVSRGRLRGAKIYN